ncbi:aldose 1-epimerase family protein [soil metagenome]
MTGAATPSGEQHVLTHGDQRAVVVEVGGGLRCYDDAAGLIVAGYPEHEICPRAAGAVLVPWPNRLAGGTYRVDGEPVQVPISEPARNSANHGLARWTRWRLVERGPAYVELAWPVPPQPAYPFGLDVRTRWSLDDRGLRAQHSTVNVGAGVAPFGLGVHPYLHLTALAETVVRVPARTRLLVDDDQRPVGAADVTGTQYDLDTGEPIGDRRFDTCFTDLRRDADGVARMLIGGTELWMDGSFGWLQVFTPPDGSPGPIAVEPMTCPPDAFNSGDGLVRLQPGQRWTGSWGLVRVAR